MKSSRLRLLTVIAALPLTLLALNPTAAAAQGPKPVPPGCVPPVELSDLQAADLSFTRDEERMALELYTLFAETYELPGRGVGRNNLRIFSTIARSEQTHTSTVLTKLKQYCLPDPAAGWDEGEYVEDAIQQLYDGWSADGLEDLAGALQVGIELEQRDIDDLEALIAKENPADIEQVYVNLCEGSLNHWAAYSEAAGEQAPEVEGRCLPSD